MATNLPGSLTNSQLLFNSTVTPSINLDPEVYEQLLAFFRTKTDSISAAKQLTESVISLTYENKLDPLKILNEFNKAANTSELKTLLIAFFNSLRPATSRIGFNNNITTNFWVQRNLLS